MDKTKYSTAPADQLVRTVLRAKHPSTVGELWMALSEQYDLDEQIFIETVRSMSNQGAIKLSNPSYQFETPLDYLFSLSVAGWLWAFLFAVFLTVSAVVAIPPSSALAPIRWGLGSVLVLYLPGYGLLRLLFPVDPKFDGVERLALTVGVSLAIVPLVGLALDFTPWGIRFESIISSLALFTLCCVTVAAVREYLRSSR